MFFSIKSMVIPIKLSNFALAFQKEIPKTLRSVSIIDKDKNRVGKKIFLRKQKQL